MVSKINCRVLTITTPNQVCLDGLFFGHTQSSKVIIFVHGLGANCFSHLDILLPLVNKNTAVITFNNRGHDQISQFKTIDRRRKKGYYKTLAGEVHEQFTDSPDDIQGVINLVKNIGIPNIFLMGHSTGSQKASFFLRSKLAQKQIKGLILLSPMSDYAAITQLSNPQKLKKALAYSHNLVRQGKEHDIVPKNIWPYQYDAQRLVSLYSPDSVEDIFCYGQDKKIPTILNQIKLPTLVVLAEKDEYRDRNIKKIKNWFESHLHNDKQIAIVPHANHNFNHQENTVVTLINQWLY